MVTSLFATDKTYAGENMSILTNFDELPMLTQDKNIFFYGAGGGGLKLLKTIQECYEHFQISAFLDTYKKGTLAGLPVIPFSEYKHNPARNFIVIASLYYEEISTSLKEHGIHDFSVLHHFWLCDFIFTTKDRQFKQHEINQILAMLATPNDKKLFQYLLDARTHGSSLTQLHQDETSGNITLQFRTPNTINSEFAEHSGKQYLDFINFQEIQTVVQAGVYDGKDIINLVQLAPNFTKAYGFEPSGSIYFLPELKKLMQQKRFVHEQLALWHKNTNLFFSPNVAGSFVSDSIEPSTNAISIQAITLDEYCDTNQIEKIDFICCDIENAEINFLKGARNTIVKDRPQMAISIYHSKKQFLEVPLFLNALLENYTFKLGHYGTDVNETALYAIPNEIYESKHYKNNQEHHENK